MCVRVKQTCTADSRLGALMQVAAAVDFVQGDIVLADSLEPEADKDCVKAVLTLAACAASLSHAKKVRCCCHWSSTPLGTC